MFVMDFKHLITFLILFLTPTLFKGAVPNCLADDFNNVQEKETLCDDNPASIEENSFEYLFERKIPGKKLLLTPEQYELSKTPPPVEDEFIPVHDRWSMFYLGKWFDPYNQNRLKGDLPIFGAPGHEWFLELEIVSLSLVEQRSLPTPVGVSSTRSSDSTDVFGDFNQLLAEENLILQVSLIKGNTAFKPQDIEIRMAPIFSFNYVDVNETGFLRADPVRGSSRNDQHVGFRELFADIHLGDINDRYDFYSSRLGIQRFNADFRGFVFFDEAPGARLFGTLDNNKYQWNAAWFSRLDKDSNALQNKIFDRRDEEVFLANLYRQDLFFLGHTVQGVLIHREDTAGNNPPDYDDNNFIVRPASLGMKGPRMSITLILV
jgi:hypothetical protein